MALLQDAATTGNGTAYDTGGTYIEHTFYIDWSAGCSAGEVTIETARAASYAGTWASMHVEPWSAASTVACVQMSGPLKALRARITSNVVGGTVTVEYLGSQ